MASYRVYFRGPRRRIIGRDDFEAESDSAAAAIADMLFDACSDVAAEYELWQGPTRIENQAWRHAATLARLTEHRQERVIDHEERLRDSRWAIASSQRLLDTLTAWKRYRVLG